MSNQLKNWNIAGIIATVVIILTIPIYWMKENAAKRSSEFTASEIEASFVGSNTCKDCHKPEYDRWSDSHHRWSMAEVTEETVLGNFDDAVFEHFGERSLFFRRDGRFYVETQGVGGETTEFEITHTFGWSPLQQYLIPFPGGRMQCLPIAWDVERNTWYHLYPDAPLDPDDWLYWTNNGQNWNGMCAECHSTDLRKNYDLVSDTYKTIWSEISVGCEACHGPGSEHVGWARMPEMGRPVTENVDLTVKTRDLSSRQQIELCAPCHARRMSLLDNIHRHDDFLDYGIPHLLTEGMYFADGQILEEVYVYGSFMQSKMYSRDVRCSDCHDVHSIRRVKEGNDLCLNCHRAAVYDGKNHHFHKKAGEGGKPIRSADGEILYDVGTGSRCEACHMPGRYYMGIDYRPDHSFRIPRPDLTLEIGTPNACDRCHVDRSTSWSVDAVARWYGEKTRPHYGRILHAARAGSPEVTPELMRLVGDRLYPAIVRATALAELAALGPERESEIFVQSLTDEESLMRQTAARHLPETDQARRLQLLVPLLYDPVRGVRIEAARGMAPLSRTALSSEVQEKYERTLEEYRDAMERTADFATSRHNLGNLYSDLGEDREAIAQYQKALEIDSEFFPAAVNLALLYNRTGKNREAEELFRNVVIRHPDLHEVRYNLGLLLAEENKYEEAAHMLKEASAGLPERSRIHYNLGLLLQKLERDTEAEDALKKALDLEPDNPDYLYGLAVFYLERRNWADARRMARELRTRHPDLPIGDQLMLIIEEQERAAGDRQPEEEIE